VDFALANHYVSTYRDSRFVTHLLIRAITPDGRVSAMNRDLTVLRDGVAEKRQIADRRELRVVLAAHFGFDLPEIDALTVPSLPEWT